MIVDAVRGAIRGRAVPSKILLSDSAAYRQSQRDKMSVEKGKVNILVAGLDLG